MGTVCACVLHTISGPLGWRLLWRAYACLVFAVKVQSLAIDVVMVVTTRVRSLTNGNGRRCNKLHNKEYLAAGDGSGPSKKPTAGVPLVQTTLTNCRYPAWQIYMPSEGLRLHQSMTTVIIRMIISVLAFSEGSQSARFVSAFTDYFQTHLPHYNLVRSLKCLVGNGRQMYMLHK